LFSRAYIRNVLKAVMGGSVVDAVSGRRGVARVGVITVVPDEFQHAKDVFDVRHNLAGTPYHVKEHRTDRRYELALFKLADRGTHASLEGTRDLIEDLRPSVILLVGIAGGIGGRDGTKLGDVIIADFVDYYEFRKVVDGRNQMRRIPFDQPSLLLRHRIGEQVISEQHWASRVNARCPAATQPQAIVGNIISGEKLLGDPNNEEQRRILNEFDKALAADMESYGVARAVFHSRESVHYNPQYLVIRGISDLVNQPGNDQQRQQWRPYASNTAAAFAAEVVDKIRDLPL
jgi:nucleoside phosphorylase